MKQNYKDLYAHLLDMLGAKTHEEAASIIAEYHSQDVLPDMKQMVTNFLSWRLPEDFYPDAGISFARNVMKSLPDYAWPTGTNLFHAGQAEDMIKHIISHEKVNHD